VVAVAAASRTWALAAEPAGAVVVVAVAAVAASHSPEGPA
jgi:hypothetical protein